MSLILFNRSISDVSLRYDKISVSPQFPIGVDWWKLGPRPVHWCSQACVELVCLVIVVCQTNETGTITEFSTRSDRSIPDASLSCDGNNDSPTIPEWC